VLWSASLPTTDGYPCRYSLCLRCRSDDAQVAPRAKQTRNRAHALICNCKIPLRVLAAADFSSILVGRLHQPRRHDGTNVFALSRDVLTRASPGGDLVRQWLEDLANYTRAPITTRRARMRAHSQPGLLPACGSWRRRASSPRDTRKRSPRGLRWVTTFAAQTSRMSGALRRRGSPLSLSTPTSSPNPCGRCMRVALCATLAPSPTHSHLNLLCAVIPHARIKPDSGRAHYHAVCLQCEAQWTAPLAPVYVTRACT
jgi:hypothetical protein